jgi:hypothetical protein
MALREKPTVAEILRQHFPVFPCRNASQQRAQHGLAQAAVLTQHFVGGNLHFPFGLGRNRE